MEEGHCLEAAEKTVVAIAYLSFYCFPITVSENSVFNNVFHVNHVFIAELNN